MPTFAGLSSGIRYEAKLFARDRFNSVNAAIIAQVGDRGLMQGQTVVVLGLKNQILTTSARFMPRNAVTNIVKNMQSQS